MSDAPTALILHSVDAAPGMDPDELASEIEARVPDADLEVARNPPESAAKIGDAELVLSVFPLGSLLAEAENLAVVQALSAGVDLYDLDALAERDLVVANASGVSAEPIAEQVLGYMLLFERRLLRGIGQQDAGVWDRYGGGELRGKTLGIVGVGAIGSRVADYGQDFGMTVVGTKRDPADAPDAVDEIYPAEELYEVLGHSDYVVVACPLTEETRGLLGRAELSAMAADAVLVNVARGPIVDQDALVDVIQQGVIGGAALDVFEDEPLPGDSPLWDHPDVVVTPHMAGSTPYHHERLAEVFATNYEAYRAGEPGAYTNRVL